MVDQISALSQALEPLARQAKAASSGGLASAITTMDSRPLVASLWTGLKESSAFSPLMEVLIQFAPGVEPTVVTCTGVRRRCGHEDWAQWLVSRALQVDSLTAATELRRYAFEQDTCAKRVGLLPRLWIDCKSFTFSNDTEIVRVEEITDPRVRSLVPSGVCPWPEVRVIMLSDTASNDAPPGPASSFSDLALCLSLCLPPCFGVSLFAEAIVIPDHVPSEGFGQNWHFREFRHPQLQPAITSLQLEHAKHYHDAFSKLSDIQKDRFRVPLERLNAFGMQGSGVDALVELRIAMEATFFDEKAHSLSFQTALRAAKFLEQANDNREAVFEAFKRVYDQTSTAVHTGRAPKKKFNWQEVERIAGHVGRALKMRLESPETNWREIELQR
ncbi:MAG: hypothetical protein OXU20_05165 [Myxococcales bacterium]|nr:hypothetical protein [Myxococcales bacterium]MDD9969071.1 hypothetical protein [Myxococcales bacterium]